eukprot:NODE_6753_length_539_cov_16.510204_g6329_i0.p2 GENE.NODE_6753_length_539_cov_16.510204_g6329_i0~~NODE_6753_length_539_cov_16.510204_g6329_i0.p2  ORF type:complete len:106 (+),score=15.88 NODE_6753_length_539_cov_16.510204_g6329_i0:144-461(+)
MVCDDCATKRKGNITPDKWKDGAHNTTESGGRKAKATNSLINRQGSSSFFNPYLARCKVCKTTVPTKGGKYCITCASKKGVCHECGKKIFDTKYVGGANAYYSKA